VSAAVMDKTAASRLLEKTVSEALKRGALGAECAWSSSHARSFRVRDDELERSSTAERVSIGLRVLDGKNRQGVASLSEFDGDTAAELCDAAFENARHNAPEDDVIFASKPPEMPQDKLALYDEEIPRWEPEEQIALCLDMSREARRLDKRIRCVATAGVSTGWGDSLCLNHNGIRCESRATYGSLGLTLLGEDGDASEINGAGCSARSAAKLRSTLPVAEAVNNTVRLFHGRTLPSGRYRLVLEPSVTVAFLGELAELFSAVSVYKGLSLLKGKMGQSVASDKLTLIDDGRIPAGMGSSAFDSEMVATRRTVLLDRGELSSWLCNLQYGRRLGFESTGNGCRGLSSLPDVDVNNFYVLPGSRSRDEIIAANDGCFCVAELMGLHTIDTVTGDFSLGARGHYYKNGVFSPVSSVTVAGKLTDLLKNITEVGADLRFFDRFGGCTMVVDDIAVAGT